jgi:hypothetical protein
MRSGRRSGLPNEGVRRAGLASERQSGADMALLAASPLRYHRLAASHSSGSFMPAFSLLCPLVVAK